VRQARVLSLTLMLTALLGGMACPAVRTSAQEEIEPQETFEGRLIAIASSIRFDAAGAGSISSVTLLLQTDLGELTVTLAPDAGVLDQMGLPAPPGQLQPESLLRVLGRRTSATSVEASRVQVVDAPAVRDTLRP
jgi:hypothetical protein